MKRANPLVATLLLFIPIAAAQGESRTVWEIGKFDRSPLEFTRGTEDHVAFQVGTSDWKKDWPGHQRAGVPYRISFSLDSISGLYSLKIAGIITSPRVPTLHIAVNGHEGTFYFHPKLSYFQGDFQSVFDPHYSESTLDVDLPSGYLKQGENTILLTCVDDPPSPADQRDASSISYDALSLIHDDSKKYSPQTTNADIEPTVFYRKEGAGLVEIVDAFVRFGDKVPASAITLEVEGKRYAAKLQGGREFGEERISFEIPEWTGNARGKLQVEAGKRRSFDVTLTAARKWTVFVVPHTHLDVGFTDYQGKVAEMQSRVLSQAANLIHQYPDFRFSMDGSWNLEQLLDTRPKAKRDEILDLIRSGKMAMPAQYCNLLTGYASLETLYRSLYASKDLSRRYGLPFEYANITDVPTYSGSYPSILASSGVKYWVAGSNNDRAPVFFHEHWNEKSPFWWQGPDGKKVLFWYSRHYMQVQTLFGLPPMLPAIRESLPIYLQAFSKPDYKLDAVLIYGTQVENTDLFPSTATFIADWNKQYEYPKLTYATFPDFFHYIARHGNELPTYKGDGGPYWEDGIGSDAYFAAEDRGSQNRALSAEVLSSVTHSIDINLNPPAGLLTDIWRNIILFSEHTWTAWNSISQPDHVEAVKQLRVKDSRAERASLEIDDLINRSMSQLADRIHAPANTLVVFNSLSWRRDAMVETDLFDHAKLVDLATGESIPLQILFHKEGFLHARFLVKDLPAVGYKCLQITYPQDTPAVPESGEAIGENAIENAFYRVKIDAATGAVASIYDKQLQRELVDESSPYKFGQYIYVTGGDGRTEMVNAFPTLPPGELTVHNATNGKFVGAEKFPWGQSVHLSSSALNTPEIDTEILLFDREKKIEFRYQVRKDYTTSKEGVYFAFPVKVSAPQFAYAAQQGWVDPAHDLLKGASLEWFNIQQWMAARDAALTVGIVPVDAPLASFGDINRGKWPAEFRPKSGTLFSYAMNNYWHTNYRGGQGGEFHFRYALTSAATLNPDALSRLGADEMRPAEINYVMGQDKVGNPERPLPAEGTGFMEVSAPNIALITWKRAEDENGAILRLQETAGRKTETNVEFARLPIGAAELSSGTEDNLNSIPVDGNKIKLSFAPYEVLTVRVHSK